MARSTTSRLPLSSSGLSKALEFPSGENTGRLGTTFNMMVAGRSVKLGGSSSTNYSYLPVAYWSRGKKGETQMRGPVLEAPESGI